jgi:hypothetical protein
MYINDPTVTLVLNDSGATELDVTELCSSAEIDVVKPQVSGQNTYGRTHQRRELKGLWDGSVKLTLHADWDSESDSGVSSALIDLLEDDDPFLVKIRTHDAEISDTNPEFQCMMSLSELPLSGDPGELAIQTITLEVAGDPLWVTEPESS